MWKVFKIEDVIDFAVQIETNGEKFYDDLSKKVKDSKVAGIFTYLAKEEAKHKQDFKTILGSLQEKTINESYPGEYEDYLRGIASNHVFTKDLNELINEIDSPKDAIDTAIRFEQDSILYFLELEKLVSERDKQTVKKLIDEEKLHILKLIDLKRQIN